MSLRDFAVILMVCLLWALNIVLSRVVIADMGAPPLFFAAARFGLVALVTLPWLLPMPRPQWRLLAVALLMGAGNFALMFIGLKTASPSSVAVVSQLGVPIITLLSVVMLGETIRWRRGLGILLSLAGVLLVMWDPHGLKLSAGLMFVVAGAFAGSLGAVMMKQIEWVKPLQFQAWVGFASVWPLLALSFAIEPGAPAAAGAAGWPLLGAVVFSALMVSVVAHTAYYWLIQRYDANLIAPLTLMSPLMTILLGVSLTHDHFDMRIALGTVVTLCGVMVIALRPSRIVSRLLVLRNRD